MTTPSPAPARPAATAIVLRPASEHPFDVLLVRRNDSVAFMGGAYVFPGGRVDDTDIVSAHGCDGFASVGRCLDLERDVEASYRVAAIRELIEEAGVLLARRNGEPADAATAAAVRSGLQPRISFVDQVHAQGLRVSLDAVMPFAHWVTPAIEIRRYDTRFLMARVPSDQEGSHDAGETTALEWMTPYDAIARCWGGEIMLPPPTWATLRRLARFGSIDEAWHWACTTPIVRIEPGFLRDGERSLLMLPGDPTYPRPDGCEPFEDTRFELVDGGGWRPVTA